MICRNINNAVSNKECCESVFESHFESHFGNHGVMNRHRQAELGKRSQRGFSLVELLVVVIIIGILAAVAVPIYLNQRRAAWNSDAQSDVKNAQIVVETAATSNKGKLPTQDSEGNAVTYPIECKGGGSGSTAALADQTLTCSAGVTITVTKTGDATYTITGEHDNGTKKYVYDSTSHGVTEEDK